MFKINCMAILKISILNERGGPKNQLHIEKDVGSVT